MNEKEIERIIERVKREAIPVGAIICHAAEKCPEGYLPCDGKELLRSEYPELFAVIGISFGGGERTFQLPDLQGRFARGWDKEGNTDPDRTFGSTQEDAIQGHGHMVTPKGEMKHAGGHTHKVYYKHYDVGSNVFENDKTVYEIPSLYSANNYLGGNPGTSQDGLHNHQLPQMTATDTTTTKWGVARVDTETRPKNIALLFCIKAR